MAKKDRMLATRSSGFWANLWPQGMSKLWIERPRSLIERLKSPAKPAQDEISAVEPEINRELAVALGTLGLRVVGGLGL